MDLFLQITSTLIAIGVAVFIYNMIGLWILLLKEIGNKG